MVREWKNHHQELSRILKDKFGNRDSVIGLEIGTMCGDSARQILWSLPNCKMLYTVDPWRHVDGAEFEAGEKQDYHDKNKELAYRKLSVEDIKDRVTILPMTSAEAKRVITEKYNVHQFDFVWIDGDHSENGIRTDLELFTDMVKEGGLLGGHDFGQVHPLTEVIFNTFDKCLNSANDYVWYVNC